MISLWEKGEVEKARELYLKLLPLCQAMFYETNPIPVKTALSLMGKIKGELRLPLCPMSKENLERLKKVLRQYDLIKE